MNIRKTILTSLVLAVMGLFLAGCGCEGGQCPFKKLFGSKPKPCPSSTESAPATAPETK